MARENDLRLPPEAALSKKFGVSVVTVRQALSSLEARGLVIRKRKTGTIIRKEALGHRKLLELGMMADTVKQQQSDWTELLSSQVISVPPTLKAAFSGQRNVLQIVRRRFVGGEPGSYAVNLLNMTVAAQLDFGLVSELPITQILHERTNCMIGRIEQEITAELADPVIAQHLRVEPLSATLVLVGRTHDPAGLLLDMARIVYRADSFGFLFAMAGDQK